jgi:hypothetical protein
MTKPPYTWVPAADGNYGDGRSAPITQITFHHIVGDAQAAIARFQTPGVEVSATYIIGSDGRLYQAVHEEDTPFTDGNYASNSRSITIEHAGGLPSVPYTEAMYQTSIQLVAYLLGKYDIQQFKRHRDVSDSPTACPGSLDVERIIREAQGGAMSKDVLTKEEVQVAHKLAFFEPAPKSTLDYYVGKDLSTMLTDFAASDPRKAVEARFNSPSSEKLEQIKKIVQE